MFVTFGLMCMNSSDCIPPTNQKKRPLRTKYPFYCTCCEIPVLLETSNDAYKHRKKMKRARQQIDQDSNDTIIPTDKAENILNNYMNSIKMGVLYEKIANNIIKDKDILENASSYLEIFNR